MSICLGISLHIVCTVLSLDCMFIIFSSLFYCHRPMYTATSQDFNEQIVTDALQAHLEPLFKVCTCVLANSLTGSINHPLPTQNSLIILAQWQVVQVQYTCFHSHLSFSQTYEVDLALWAHHHSYQRTCLVYRGYCMFDKGQGTVHLVVGTGGTSLESDKIRYWTFFAIGLSWYNTFFIVNPFSNEVPNWIKYINAQVNG